MNVSTQGDVEDQRWAAEQTDWGTWLARHGLDKPAPKSEIIPLPSGGVFAEAVLGRFNAAEKLDLTRFWNWQDSPIPITAPEIAPVQAGSRAQSDDIRPGQLSAPVVTIQNPTSLPDATGVGAILTALQQGNMFRDMSGLAQTAALAQAGVQASAQGATAAGQQAANTLATVMANNTERMRIAAQLLAGTGGLGGGGGGGGAGAGGQQPPGKGTVSERGGELNAAQSIGNQIDQGSTMQGLRGASGGSDAGGSGGSSVDPNMPDMMSTTPGTQLLADTFRQQTGVGGGMSQATDSFTRQLMDSFGGEDVILADSRGRGTGTRSKGRTITVTGRFVTNVDQKFRFGGILMRVYEGDMGRLLWKPGSMTAKTVTYIDAFTKGNEIVAKIPGVQGDTVTVELAVQLLGPDHDLDPNIAVVNFGAAAVYNLRSDGTLRVIADVEVANKTFTVDAADDSIARQKAAAQLTAEEQRILIIDDVKKLSAGKFRVAMSIPTKKILMRTPQAVRVVY